MLAMSFGLAKGSTENGGVTWTASAGKAAMKPIGASLTGTQTGATGDGDIIDLANGAPLSFAPTAGAVRSLCGRSWRRSISSVGLHDGRARAWEERRVYERARSAGRSSSSGRARALRGHRVERRVDCQRAGVLFGGESAVFLVLNEEWRRMLAQRFGISRDDSMLVTLILIGVGAEPFKRKTSSIGKRRPPRMPCSASTR